LNSGTTADSREFEVFNNQYDKTIKACSFSALNDDSSSYEAQVFSKRLRYFQKLIFNSIYNLSWLTRNWCKNKFSRLIKHLNILEKSKVISFFEEHFVKNRRILDVEILANNHVEENEKIEVENREVLSKENIKRIKMTKAKGVGFISLISNLKIKKPVLFFK
jgi:hypothetical protein